uniref:Secreted protein n=1 Tax=Achlya hypogyna TaxID=1202772 RepID=A0A0A7CNA7_ACHHY|nr:secreted protein [Achlya hypogyna]
MGPLRHLLALAVLCGGARGSDEACSAEIHVVLETAEPLGVVLSERLQITSFVHDEQGRDRPLEATGRVEVGDVLTSVNGQVPTSLGDAVQLLQAASLPRTLTFRAASPRCCSDAAPKTDSFVRVATDGMWTETFFAVKSDFGDAPQCFAYPLVLAAPVDACAPLRVDVSQRYVLAQSSQRCSAHQQALLVGQAGGLGVVLAQFPEKKPEALDLPRGFSGEIRTPVIMVSQTSGQIMASMLASNPMISFVVTPQCSDGPATPASAAQDALATTTAGNLVALADGASHTFPVRMLGSETLLPGGFLKAPSSPVLALGRFKLRFAAESLCGPSARLRFVKGAFVVAAIDAACSSHNQVPRGVHSRDHVNAAEAAGASGLVFSTASSILQRRPFEEPLVLPTVFLSATAVDALRILSGSSGLAENGEVYIEFEPSNVHEHQYEELAALTHMGNWPASTLGRRVLYHRVRRAIAEDPTEDKAAALDALYAQADLHYGLSVER